MIQKTDLEVKKTAILKAARAAIRLKHSLAADAELNETLPQIEKQIDTALAAGKAVSFNPAKYLDA